jgi:hypothetical protein
MNSINSMHHSPNSPDDRDTTYQVDEDEMREAAKSYKERGAEMVRQGFLPADYLARCWNLGDVRRAVTAAEVRKAEANQ